MKDLGLSKSTRLDVWSGSEWLTITIHGVVPVEKGQRLILKIRPSLRNGLDDCPGIEEELKKEEKRRLVVKKSRVEFVSPIKTAPRTDSTSSVQNTGPLPAAVVSALPASILPPPANAEPPFSLTLPAAIPRTQTPTAIQSTTSFHPIFPTQMCPKASALPAQLNQSPKAKLKHWPFDFYVYEIHNGLCQMRNLASTGSVSRDQHRRHQSKKSKGKHAKGRKITVKAAFQAAFPNTKWVKTTFYDHHKLWFEQEVAIRELFIDLGASKEATYTNFLATIDHPSRLPSPAASDSESPELKKSTHSQKKRCRSSSTSSDSNSESDESPSRKGKKTKKTHKKRRRSSSMSSSGSADEIIPTSAGYGIDPSLSFIPASESSVSFTPHHDPIPTSAGYGIDPSLSIMPASESLVNLDWLGERVADLKEVLDEIIGEPEESVFFCSSNASQESWNTAQ